MIFAVIAIVRRLKNVQIAPLSVVIWKGCHKTFSLLKIFEVFKIKSTPSILNLWKVQDKLACDLKMQSECTSQSNWLFYTLITCAFVMGILFGTFIQCMRNRCRHSRRQRTDLTSTYIPASNDRLIGPPSFSKEAFL